MFLALFILYIKIHYILIPYHHKSQRNLIIHVSFLLQTQPRPPPGWPGDLPSSPPSPGTWTWLQLAPAPPTVTAATDAVSRRDADTTSQTLPSFQTEGEELQDVTLTVDLMNETAGGKVTTSLEQGTRETMNQSLVPVQKKKKGPHWSEVGLTRGRSSRL